MRLGKKKDKDKEAEIRSVDGITRLICLSKSQAPLKGKNPSTRLYSHNEAKYFMKSPYLNHCKFKLRERIPLI